MQKPLFRISVKKTFFKKSNFNYNTTISTYFLRHLMIKWVIWKVKPIIIKNNFQS